MHDFFVEERLTADGFVRQSADHLAPTPRWHAAVARAAVALMLQGEELQDIRVPVAWALAQVYASSTTDEELVEMVAVMTPLTGVSSSPPPPEDLYDLHR